MSGSKTLFELDRKTGFAAKVGVGAMEKLFFSKHHQNITQEVHKHSSASFLVIPQSSHQKTTLFSA